MSFYLGDKPATLFLKMRHRREEAEERAAIQAMKDKADAAIAQMEERLRAGGAPVATAMADAVRQAQATGVGVVRIRMGDEGPEVEPIAADELRKKAH
jgi:hypothetical protein